MSKDKQPVKAEEYRYCMQCETSYPPKAFTKGAPLCKGCSAELRETLDTDVGLLNEEQLDKAKELRESQVVARIHEMIKMPAREGGAPNLEQLWEDVSLAFNGTAGIAAELAIVYQGAKPTTQQKILQNILLLAAKANDKTKFTGAYDMTDEQLTASYHAIVKRSHVIDTNKNGSTPPLSEN